MPNQQIAHHRIICLHRFSSENGKASSEKAKKKDISWCKSKKNITCCFIKTHFLCYEDEHSTSDMKEIKWIWRQEKKKWITKPYVTKKISPQASMWACQKPALQSEPQIKQTTSRNDRKLQTFHQGRQKIAEFLVKDSWEKPSKNSFTLSQKGWKWESSGLSFEE